MAIAPLGFPVHCWIPRCDLYLGAASYFQSREKLGITSNQQQNDVVCFFCFAADFPQAPNLPDHDLDTYEDLVRHHVELFYSSAKRYVQESALSQRVRDWQDAIDPFLAEQVRSVQCLDFLLQ